MNNWPRYTLKDGWLIDDNGKVCEWQLFKFHDMDETDAEKWLAANDLRGSVRGARTELPQTRRMKGLQK